LWSALPIRRQRERARRRGTEPPTAHPGADGVVARLCGRLALPVARLLGGVVHADRPGGRPAEGDGQSRRAVDRDERTPEMIATGGVLSGLRIAHLIERDAAGGGERLLAELPTAFQAAGAGSG